MSKNTKEKLLDGALSLIEKKPFQNISTKEIANKSKVAEITLFRYFKTKNHILENLINQFFQIIIGFDNSKIITEENFRKELIIFFTKSIKNDSIQRRLFKVFLHVGMYKKNTFFKYAKIYEEQIAFPIEQTVEYGKKHWGYNNNVKSDISVKLLINSIGFFNIVQNVFLLREIKSYDFGEIIESGVDTFLKSLK